MRLFSTHVVSPAFGGKFQLLIGLLLLTGNLYAAPSPRPVDKAKLYFNTFASPPAAELCQVRANNPDVLLLENTDSEFKSLEKHAEGSSCSLSVFIERNIPLSRYSYFPASSRYVIFSVFRI